jgi:hypothetical protein
MLDLETWGTDPGRDIRSIGAVVFDPMTGRVWDREGESAHGLFYQNVENPSVPYDDALHYDDTTDSWSHDANYPHADPASQLCYKYSLTRDPQTVEWWSHPDRADAAAQLETDRVDLAIGLRRFAEWLDNLCHGMSGRLRIWCHGENMDEPMLRHAYKMLFDQTGQCIIDTRPAIVPWHYRSPRDTRTAFDMAGMDPATCLEAFKTGGTFHNALDDAVTQARAVCHAHGIVRGWRDARRIGEVSVKITADSAGLTQQVEAMQDVITHADNFRAALNAMRDNAEPAGVDHDDPGYWQHQINVLDRIVSAFAS